MKQRYLIIGNAENTHMLKWVKALVGYYDLYVISSKTTHASIHQLLPEDHIFDLGLNISDEGGNYRIILKFFTIKRIIKKVGPVIVNPHYITSHGFLSALIKRFSRQKFLLVQSAWGSDILVTPFRNAFYKRITRFCLRIADIATSDSLHMTEVLTRLFPVETLTFSFGLEALPDYDPDKKDFHFYYSNRMLSPNYNIGEVIRFFSKVVPADPKARLVVAHDGPDRGSLESLAMELGLDGKVTFSGFIGEEEQAANYRKAGIYISIPTSDATSVSLLEAMAYGCIPIVSDIPANREWITAGVNGLFYKSGRTGFGEIQALLKDAGAIAGKNREIIRERALFPDAIENYVDHISKLTG
jgi:glycosyltransferase involved in cell wall biosynthesis